MYIGVNMGGRQMVHSYDLLQIYLIRMCAEDSSSAISVAAKMA